MAPANKMIVIALGGNAFLKGDQKGTAKEQMDNIEEAMAGIARLVKKRYKVIITHGNGPQVGNILLRQELASGKVPEMPLYVCGAESQGQMGYMIQEALYNKLHRLGIQIPVVTVVTQVLVDPEDSAFRKPSKPIGPFYKTEKGLPREWKVVETIKGFRRVVPSPRPKRIVELKGIKNIVKNNIVICCGGGGIPVISDYGLKGVDAVIDKDLASELLATSMGVKTLVILTDVENVFVNYKKLNQRMLEKVDIIELKKLYREGQFPAGSMGPKIQAAIKFMDHGGEKVVITSFGMLEKALQGKAGTIIVKAKKRNKSNKNKKRLRL